MNLEISQKNLFITTQEVEKLFKSISPCEQKYRILLLLVASGCRPGEACSLNINNIIRSDCSQFYVENTKCHRRDIKIVSQFVAAELKSFIERSISEGQIKEGYVFPTCNPTKRKHMSPDSLNVWFSKKRRELGFTDKSGFNAGIGKPSFRISCYSLRRFYATMMCVQGQDMRVVSALMGHLDSRITNQYVDKLRILELAPKAVECMPHFFSAGQEKLTQFL